MIAFYGQFGVQHPRDQFAKWLWHYYSHMNRGSKSPREFILLCHFYSALRMNIPKAKVPEYIAYLKYIKNKTNYRPFFQ